MPNESDESSREAYYAEAYDKLSAELNIRNADARTRRQIDETKWELTMLIDFKRQLALVGRDNIWDLSERIKRLRDRLDHLLGFEI